MVESGQKITKFRQTKFAYKDVTYPKNILTNIIIFQRKSESTVLHEKCRDNTN